MFHCPLRAGNGIAGHIDDSTPARLLPLLQWVGSRHGGKACVWSGRLSSPSSDGGWPRIPLPLPLTLPLTLPLSHQRSSRPAAPGQQPAPLQDRCRCHWCTESTRQRQRRSTASSPRRARSPQRQPMPRPQVVPSLLAQPGCTPATAISQPILRAASGERAM